MKKLFTFATAFMFTGIVACSSLMPFFKAAAAGLSLHCQQASSTESETMPSCDHSEKINLGIQSGKTPSSDDIELSWQLPLNLWTLGDPEVLSRKSFVEPPAWGSALAEGLCHPHRNLILRL